LQKFLSRWLILILISLPLGLLWLHAEIRPEAMLPAAFKLGLVMAALSGGALAIGYTDVRRWAVRVRGLEAYVNALPTAQGNLAGNGPREIERLARSINNMSEHVRQVVERANLESSRREAILSCMAEGVLAVDADLKVIFCNEAFAEAFSARNLAAEGRTLYEVVREPALREILERVLRTGDAEKNRFQLPTADSRWFESRAIPLGSEPKRGAVIVLHDISDLQNQEQVRKDFVADVSHELRTPLSAIRGYAETLLDGGLEDRANNRNFVEVILSHAIRLGNIASDLLVLSELDSDANGPVEPQRISVLEVVESAILSVENAALMRGVRIHRDNCRECFVSGLRFRLEQVVVNLLDNAVKFNRDEGEVVIECGYIDEKHVRIVVGDTGIGIPSGDIKRVFERFYRVDKARSRPAGGTGLGLPIVREVVDRMGGTVAVESVLGRGSKFTVTLKAA
jgi:two-component system phosphate regulon sensor histidine kinase PhoR